MWASSFAYFDGPRAFAILARRMEELPDLAVTLLLNIQRRKSDTTAASDLVRRFAERFWGKTGPVIETAGLLPPAVIVPEEPGGVLHAKAVVADEESVFVTSANLTEAAFIGTSKWVCS